jgi:hypothetical protein
MSIQVVCPNGHRLEVQESLAGKTGLCPVCKARVSVPAPSKDQGFEDELMDILGPHKAVHTPSPLPTPPPSPGSKGSNAPEQPTKGFGLKKKSCWRCHKEIETATHICPYCRTYIASLSDFS